MTLCTAIIPVSPCVFVPAPEPPETAPEVPTLDRYVGRVHCMDALTFLRLLPSQSVQCIVTSPPYYGLRDYQVDGQIGLEESPAQYVARLVDVFRECRRVLRDDGTIWINLGDSYANDDKWGGATGGKHVADLHGNGSIGREKKATGLPPKSLLGIPWRVAFALQDDGWILRSEIIWAKPNPMPESVTDRPTKAHETVFLLSKKPTYYYDADAIAESLSREYKPGGNHGGLARRASMKHVVIGNQSQGENVDLSSRESRNKRSVWTCSTEPTPFAHFATFPTKLITPMILAGAPIGGVVLDPFAGSGTTLLVARKLGRVGVGCDLNAEYVALANDRLSEPYTPPLPMFA